MSDNLGHKLNGQLGRTTGTPVQTDSLLSTPKTVNPTNNTSNAPQGVGQSNFAKKAGIERLKFQAQRLDQDKNQARNQQKNDRLDPDNPEADTTNNVSNINQEVGKSKFAERAEKERAKHLAKKDKKKDKQTAIGESLRYLGIGLHGKKGNSQIVDKMAHSARNLGEKIDGHGSKKQAQQVSRVQNAARNKKAKKKQKSGGEEGIDVAKEGINELTKSWLTTLWSGVWFDPTLLTLLGLNAYFFASKMIPQMAQFGEDDVIGTALGGGRIAKTAKKLGVDTSSMTALSRFVETGLLFVADIIIIGIVILIIFILYRLTTLNIFEWVKGGWNIITKDTDDIIKMIFDI
jgi:hypothetical protein